MNTSTGSPASSCPVVYREKISLGTTEINRPCHLYTVGPHSINTQNLEDIKNTFSLIIFVVTADMEASTPTIVQGAEAENAIDNDNGTRAETDTATFPWISIDFGKSMRVTRVQILGGEDDNPLENLEVKVGNRNPKSPIDNSYPAMTEQLFGNTRYFK